MFCVYVQVFYIVFSLGITYNQLYILYESFESKRCLLSVQCRAGILLTMNKCVFQTVKYFFR